MLDFTDGSCCFMCACYLGDPVGHPKTCKDCDKGKAKANKPKATPNKSKKAATLSDTSKGGE